MSTIAWPWAILLCRFSDKPTEQHPPDYYRDLYTRNGAGGLADYWRAVSFNALDLTGSRVFGWFQMSHASIEVSQLTFPGDRGRLIDWGVDAARANGVDLTPFRSILVVHNWGVDHGAAGNRVLIVDQHPNSCEFGFIAHEMGHGFGLPHSYAANPDRVYGDGWDLMSFATSTAQFPIAFQGSRGDATVGLNARNLEALGATPQGRAWSPPGPDFGVSIVLDPLNQPPIGNRGHLVVKIPPSATRPARADGSSYLAEFHIRAGWDQGIARDAVVMHQVRGDGLSYLVPGRGSHFVAGQEFVTPAPEVRFRVVQIDPVLHTASLRVWDLPEGCLRKEDSKPEVYQIRNGQKCWVTSPQALAGLGKTWDDVRGVPDGALDALPRGPDIFPPPALRVTVTPRPPALDRPVTVTVHAADAASGAAVAGQVSVEGRALGATDTSLTATFRLVRRRVNGAWEYRYPVGRVAANGYPTTTIDFGWPDL